MRAASIYIAKCSISSVTEFVGYTDDVSESRVVAVIPTVDENGEEAVELFLDRPRSMPRRWPDRRHRDDYWFGR